MPNHHLSPHYYAFTTIAAAAACFFVFQKFGYHDQFFYGAILLVATFWGIGFWRRQQHGGSAFYVEKKQSIPTLLRRAVMRYVVWSAVFATGLYFYNIQPYYHANVKTIQFLTHLFVIFLVIGIPYFMLTLKCKASRVEDFYDPAIRLLHIARHLRRGLLARKNRALASRVLKRSTNRKVLLNLLMRCYFIPVMVVQVFNGYRDTVGLAATDFNGYQTLAIISWITTFLWLTDSLTASTGYAIESRWLENRSRSVDLTVSGWLVCLCCYAPLNQVTGAVFAFSPLVASSDPNTMVFPFVWLLVVLKIAEACLLACLVYCDLSLGPSGVNITFKKLQDRGPYSIVRHPATVCKLTFWWLSSFLFINFWSTEIIVGQLMWNAIYILRALSEERHLSQFAEYRDYKERVRYRFIPGVI